MASSRPIDHDHLHSLLNVSFSEEDISEYENHTSGESESEDEFINSAEDITSVHSISSKDNEITWKYSQPTQIGRASLCNIIRQSPGITRFAANRIIDIRSSFELLFHSSIQSYIIKMTNIEGEKIFGNKWAPIDEICFQAYIGLLILAGVYKSHGESTKSLWNEETGRAIFGATMSLEKFGKISRVIRFDDKSTRQERRRNDKLAPIRDVWCKWNEILPKLYYPSENITVDEQLVGFRGRCPFKQYIPTKPAKYGIKIWTLCDSKTSYALQTQVYTGKQPGERPEKNQGMRVVNDLTQEYKGHNVYCDNFFTSYSLGQLLLKKKLTMVGTIRKNKAELPKELKNKEIHSSEFFFTKDTTVVNYVPKKNKNVLLMSTFHHSKEISERSDKKPQIIMDYNASKGAVDTLDQLVSTYTCKRKTNRWPMILFYNILDVSAYNAFVLWKEVNPQWNKNKLHKRRIFIEELGKSLVLPHITSRVYQSRNESSQNIARRLQQSVPVTDLTIKSTASTKRSRCKFCSKSDNKTNIQCVKCTKYICKTHTTYYCPDCKED